MAEPNKDDISMRSIDEMAIEEALDDLESDFDEIETLRAERDEFRDRFMRALADAENSRKRGERDRREAEQYGGSKLSRDMLPVYDNMKRALDTVTEGQREASKALIEGIELTMRELLNVFQKHGIERVAPEIGDTVRSANASGDVRGPGARHQGWRHHSGHGRRVHAARSSSAPGAGWGQLDPGVVSALSARKSGFSACLGVSSSG